MNTKKFVTNSLMLLLLLSLLALPIGAVGFFRVDNMNTSDVLSRSDKKIREMPQVLKSEETDTNVDDYLENVPDTKESTESSSIRLEE